MLLTKEVEIKWESANRKWFESKGYTFTKWKDKFIVKINELPEKTHIKIQVLCDYCLESIITKEYRAYISGTKNTIIKKDCCHKCRIKKIKESNTIVYGVESTLQVKDVKTKIKDSLIKKYGVDNPFKSIEIQEKIKKRNLDLYGVGNASQRPEIVQKIQNTFISKYGVKNIMQLPDSIDKVKETNLKKYGTEWYAKSDECKNKIISTNINKYGKEYFTQTEEYKIKSLATNFKKYHTQNPSQYNEIKNKVINTNQQKYGVSWYTELFDNKKANHPNWKGGISNISEHLRGVISQWKIDSLTNYNYSCILSNISSHDLVVHHLISFNQLVKETFDTCKIEIKNEINKYSTTELLLLEKTCIDIHYKYGFGVPLLPIIHNLFHKQYGKGNNTLKQFEEFKKRYYDDEFNDYITNNLVD